MLFNLIVLSTALTGFLTWLSLEPMRRKYRDRDPSKPRSKQQTNDSEEAFGVWFMGGIAFCMWLGVGLFLTFLLSVDLYAFSDLDRFLIELYIVLAAPVFALWVSEVEEVQADWVRTLSRIADYAIPGSLGLIALVGIHGSLNWYEEGLLLYARESFGVAFDIVYIVLVVTMIALVVFPAAKVWRLLAQDQKHDADLAARGRVHETGCWLCGAGETDTYSTEYGWYGERVADFSTANSTHKITEKHYLRIGDTHVDLCRACVDARALYLMETRRPILFNALCAAFFVFLPGAFLLDWFTALGLPENDIDFLFRSSGPTVFGILLGIVTFVALIAAAILGILVLFEILPMTDKTKVEASPETAEDLAWDLVKESIEEQHKETDPHYYFYPNAPPVAYSAHGIDGVGESTKKRRREESVGDDGWISTRYWIAPRESYVDNWEAKPLEPRRNIYSFTERIEP